MRAFRMSLAIASALICVSAAGLWIADELTNQSLSIRVTGRVTGNESSALFFAIEKAAFMCTRQTLVRSEFDASVPRPRGRLITIHGPPGPNEFHALRDPRGGGVTVFGPSRRQWVPIGVRPFNGLRFKDLTVTTRVDEDGTEHLTTVEYAWVVKDVFVSAWVVLVTTSIYPILVWRRAFRARRRSASNLCEHCGYDLRASPARCPECGSVPSRPNEVAAGAS